MRVILQRVQNAQCAVKVKITGKIDQGLLVFVGFGKAETQEKLMKMAAKIAQARVFEDELGKMNLNVMQIQGKILSISQFTLYGDTTKGHRPSYDQAAQSDDAKAYYEAFNHYLSSYCGVETGQFQAHMDILALQDGPVTLSYEN